MRKRAENRGASGERGSVTTLKYKKNRFFNLFRRNRALSNIFHYILNRARLQHFRDLKIFEVNKSINKNKIKIERKEEKSNGEEQGNGGQSEK